MSEVKSAKELADGWIKYNTYKSMEYDYDILSTDAEEDLEDTIISDRRAIIEKCKEAIHDEAKLYSPDVAKFDYGYCWAILNSVLSDLEKEE
jgi:CYTH domain-containing protein